MIELDNYFKTDETHRLINQPSCSGFIASGFVQKKGVTLEFEGYYDYAVVVYLLNGTGIFKDWQGKEYKLKPGSAFIRDPRFYHKVTINDGCEWVEGFVSMQLKSVDNETGVKPGETWQWIGNLAPGSDFVPIFMDISGLFDKYEPVTFPGIKLEILEKIDILSQKLRNSSPKDLPFLHKDWIEIVTVLRRNLQEKQNSREKKLVQEICSKITENPLSRTPFPELLKEYPASYQSLRNWFKEEMGCSLGDFRIRNRLDLASSMLISGDRSVKEIAAELGYNDQFALSKQFKKFIGCSPEAYRKRRFSGKSPV